MRRYLLFLSISGLVLLQAQCSLVDKAKTKAKTISGGSSNSSGTHLD